MYLIALSDNMMVHKKLINGGFVKVNCSKESENIINELFIHYIKSIGLSCTLQGELFSLHCLDFQTEDRLTPQWHVGHSSVATTKAGLRNQS